MFKDHVLVKKIKSFFRIFSESTAKIYLTTLGAFALFFAFIFTTPITMGSNYNFEDTPLNEYYTVTNEISIAVVKKEYNEEQGTFRVDFSMKEPSTKKSLSNIGLKITAEDIKTRTVHESKVTKVNDQYYVAFFEDIPEKFEVLSTTLQPYYIQPEIENDSEDLEGRAYKVYTNESKEIVNNDLQPLDEDEYQFEYFTFEQKEIEKEIESLEGEIKKNDLLILDLRDQNKTLESEMQFQTESEKLETKSEMNSNKTSMEQREKEIEEFKLQVENHHEKIRLLEERKNKIKK